MKHIKKKFRFETVISEERKNELKDANLLTPISDPKSKKKYISLYLHDKDGNHKLIKAFYHNQNGTKFYIPEPDPTLIYFHNAYANYKEINEVKKKLFAKLDEPKINETVSNEIYHHFGLCMGFITSLFISMESFINSVIPHSYEHKIFRNNRTEVYNCSQIQRNLTFDEKAVNVVNNIFSANFKKEKSLKWAHIENLKEFRDMIVHTKTEVSDEENYSYLFKKSFNFKYEESIHAVRDYMNFYKPNYIEECNCGKIF